LTLGRAAARTLLLRKTKQDAPMKKTFAAAFALAAVATMPAAANQYKAEQKDGKTVCTVNFDNAINGQGKLAPNHGAAIALKSIRVTYDTPNDCSEFFDLMNKMYGPK
jgi:hypothetical protein